MRLILGGVAAGFAIIEKYLLRKETDGGWMNLTDFLPKTKKKYLYRWFCQFNVKQRAEINCKY